MTELHEQLLREHLLGMCDGAILVGGLVVVVAMVLVSKALSEMEAR